MRRFSSTKRLLAVPAALVAAACGSSSTGGSGTPSTTEPAVTQAASVPASSAASVPAGEVACDWEPASYDSGDRKPGLPPTDVPAAGTASVTMKLTQGTVVFTMNRAKTPCTAASFGWLASKKYFDGTTCPRDTDPGGTLSIVQCGDPAGDGRGGPGYTIPDENLTGATYPAGTVAMANTGQPHSGGSQFFLVYADSRLPPSYTPFGTITQGLDVLVGIGKAGNDESSPAGGGRPTETITIDSFTVAVTG